MRRAAAVTVALLSFALVVRSAPPAAEGQDPPPTDEEKVLLDLVNKARVEKKLPPLKFHPVLFRVARAHSLNMAKRGELKHELDGLTPGKRVTAAGYAWYALGENIAWSEGRPPAEVVQGWMESRLHRDNILKEDFAETGLGVARDGQGNVFYTQVFAKPKR
jgi:uncharacterized protein YkwD